MNHKTEPWRSSLVGPTELDAGRINWLESVKYGRFGIGYNGFRYQVRIDLAGREYFGRTFREAIDAGIKAEPQGRDNNMENMRISTNIEGLDREHNAPGDTSYRVVAPFGLDGRESMEWVLTHYGERADSIECLGQTIGAFAAYEFRVSPKFE